MEAPILPRRILRDIWVRCGSTSTGQAGPATATSTSCARWTPPETPLLPADPLDIHFVRSEDGGVTWSANQQCSGNGIGDPLDIGNGTSTDGNSNGIPDECEDPPSTVTENRPDAAQLPNLRCTPNPFNPTTTIDYDLPEPCHVTLTVHDASGRNLATLLDDVRPAGPGMVSWNAAGHASGVYFLRLEAMGETRVAKVVLLR